MVETHILIPKHTKISDSEKNKVLEKYGVSANALPRIMTSDLAIGKLRIKVGDIVKVERYSKTAGNTVYYRTVVEG